MVQTNSRAELLRALEAPCPVAIDEWLRLPKTGEKCRVSNLSRSSLNQLVLPSARNGYRPLVRSVVLKQPGAIRGIRLISKISLLAFINSLDCSTAETARKEGL